MNLRALVAVSFALVAPTFSASAQCSNCALYPDRDPLNGGALTPAGKSGLVHAYGAASASRGPSDALAGVRESRLGVSDQQAASLKKHTRRYGQPQ